MVNQHVAACRDEFVGALSYKIRNTRLPKATRERPLTERQFVPIEPLRRILIVPTIKKLLEHSCGDCETHLQDAQETKLDSALAGEIYQRDGALSILALLVYLKYPLLIAIFVARSESIAALSLPAKLTAFDLRNIYFRHLPEQSRDELADDFQGQQQRFSAAKFTESTFRDFDDGTILPYLREEEIGRGAHGVVYKVWIHKDCCTLQASKVSLGIQNLRSLINLVKVASQDDHHPGAKILVRKEIVSLEKKDFVNEQSNLLRIAKLNDKHLVQIQKTYQLDGKYNILFPFAKTNLDKYLREDRWRVPVSSVVHQSRLWPQVLGIARALDKIINKCGGHNDQSVIGYHFDLKPANILIDECIDSSTNMPEDIFKITDFGQTVFKKATFQTSSRVAGRGGTEGYGPPEQYHEQGRAYDVWSLGIIILEVLAFTLRGREGLIDKVTGFDNIRQTKEDGYADFRCWTKGQKGVVQLKAPVAAWIKGVRDDTASKHRSSKDFICQILDLCLQMLDPDAKSRIMIGKVVEWLDTLIEGTPRRPRPISANDIKEHEDEVVLVDLQQADYYCGGRDRQHMSYHVFETPAKVIKICINGVRPMHLFNRSALKLILPLQHTDETDDNNFEVSLALLDQQTPFNLQRDRLVLHDRETFRRIQKKLLSQEISRRYRLDSGTVQFYVSTLTAWSEKLPAIMGRHCDTGSMQQTLLDLSPKWAEIWEESSLTRTDTTTTQDAEPAASTPAKGARRAKREVNHSTHTPLGRVVVYCSKCILIIPFHRASRARKDDDIGRNGHLTVYFDPQDSSQSRWFPASILQAGDTPDLLGVPMDHTQLYAEEARTQRKCSNIALTLRDPTEAGKFYNSYRNKKDRWLDATSETPRKKEPHTAPHR